MLPIYVFIIRFFLFEIREKLIYMHRYIIRINLTLNFFISHLIFDIVIKTKRKYLSLGDGQKMMSCVFDNDLIVIFV